MSVRDEQELARQMGQWDGRKRDIPDRRNSKGTEAGERKMCLRT